MGRRRVTDLTSIGDDHLVNYCRQYFDCLQVASGSDLVAGRWPTSDMVHYVRENRKAAFQRFMSAVKEIDRRFPSPELRPSRLEAMASVIAEEVS